MNPLFFSIPQFAQWKRAFRLYLGIGLLLCAQTGISAKAAGAQSAVTVTAEISSRQLTLDTSAQLTLTIEGAQNAEPAQFPAIDGLEVQYRGPSRRVSIVNGRYASSISFMYSVFPEKTGRFQIPAVTLTVDGQTFTTAAIDVEVLADSAPASGANGGASRDATLNEQMFLTLQVDPDEVYINQGVDVQVELWVAEVPLRNIQYPRFTETGFRLDGFGEPLRRQMVKDGLRYEILQFRSRLYPTRVGELTIGPARLAAEQVYREQNASRPSDPFGHFFDDSFFGGFFGNVQTRPVEAQSSSVVLNVRDVPVAGRPDGFSGAVGRFTFEAQAAPRSVQAGDPITLRMRIAGDGQLANVTFPRLDEYQSDFKVYPPTVTSDDQSRGLEQVVIPLRETVTEIPALEFHYFDPSTETFQTIRQGPFPVTVSPAPAGQGAVLSTGAPLAVSTPAPESYGEDIVYLKDQIGTLRSRGREFYHHPAYAGLLIFLALLAAGGSWGISRWQTLTGDPALIARRRASAAARRHLRELRAQAGSAAPGEFYDRLHQTLLDYFPPKWQFPSGEFSLSRLEAHPSHARLSPKSQDRLKTLITVCEAARFAGVSDRSLQPRDDFAHLEALIRECERL